MHEGLEKGPSMRWTSTWQDAPMEPRTRSSGHSRHAKGFPRRIARVIRGEARPKELPAENKGANRESRCPLRHALQPIGGSVSAEPRTAETRRLERDRESHRRESASRAERSRRQGSDEESAL